MKKKKEKKKEKKKVAKKEKKKKKGKEKGNEKEKEKDQKAETFDLSPIVGELEHAKKLLEQELQSDDGVNVNLNENVNVGDVNNNNDIAINETNTDKNEIIHANEQSINADNDDKQEIISKNGDKNKFENVTMENVKNCILKHYEMMNENTDEKKENMIHIDDVVKKILLLLTDIDDENEMHDNFNQIGKITLWATQCIQDSFQNIKYQKSDDGFYFPLRFIQSQ